MGHHPDRQDFDHAIIAAYPRLYRFARQLTRNDADASDLLQDAIERGLARRDRFQHGTAVDRWLCTILRRMFIDRCRHAQVEKRAARLARDLESGVQPACAREDDGNSGISLWELFTIKDVRRACALLPATLRRTYHLFTFEHRSYAEIATLLAIPARTAATRISRARHRLRGLLLTSVLGSQTARNDNHDPQPPAAAVRIRRQAAPSSEVGSDSRAA